MPATRRYVRRYVGTNTTTSVDTRLDALEAVAWLASQTPPARPASGEFYVVHNSGTSTSGTWTLGEIRFSRITLAVATTITGLAVNLTVNGSGGTSPAIRLGMYADDGTGTRPTGSPTTGTAVSFDPTAGGTGDRYTAFGASAVFQPGHHWLAGVLVSGTAMGTQPTIVTAQATNSLGLATLGNNTHRTWAQSAAADVAALPTIGTLYRVGAPMLIGAKVQ